MRNVFVSAGTFSERLIIELQETFIGRAGDATHTYSRLGEIGAELIDEDQAEAPADNGSRIVESAVFLTRTNMIGKERFGLSDRVVWRGNPFNIVRLRRIGKRQGFEISAERIVRDEG